jgi:hypothetical protein
MDDDHVEKVGAVIHENCHPTIREVSEEVGISKSSCHTILSKKLEIHCVAAHMSLLVHEFLVKHETTVIPQMPYSPDLAPVDLFLFPSLKSCQFQMIEEKKICYGTYRLSRRTCS